jgi:hypothetical protein
MNKNFVHQVGNQPNKCIIYKLIRILCIKSEINQINVLYINKEEFCASSWKSTKFVSETFPILRRIQRPIINVHIWPFT